MPARLPFELLRCIIGLTAPPDFHSTTYRERQDTLRSLCLVSHQFCAIAQPFLLEIVWIWTRTQFDSLYRNYPEREGVYDGSHTRTGILGTDRDRFDDEDEMIVTGVDKLKPLFSAVTRLSLEQRLCPDFGLSDLHLFPNVEDLTLVQHYADTEILGPLPNIRSLSLLSCESGENHLLLPSILPNLRALHVDSAARPLPPKLASLLPQLEAFFTTSYCMVYYRLPEYSRSILDRTLLDVDAEFLGKVTRQLRRTYDVRAIFWEEPIGLHLYDDNDDLHEELERFTRHLEWGENPPRSLYLDTTLVPELPTPARTRYRIKKLLRVCEARRIDVVFEPVPRHRCADPFVSSEYWRRQKERSRNPR